MIHVPWCPDNALLVRLSGSSALYLLSALAGCHDDGDVICLRRQAVNNPNPAMKAESVVSKNPAYLKGDLVSVGQRWRGESGETVESAYGRAPLLGNKHREAILGKVPVKGEGSGKTKPLHHGKACGISEGKVFVIILVDNRLGPLYISRRHPHHGCWALFHVPEKSSGNLLA